MALEKVYCSALVLALESSGLGNDWSGESPPIFLNTSDRTAWLSELRFVHAGEPGRECGSANGHGRTCLGRRACILSLT